VTIRLLQQADSGGGTTGSYIGMTSGNTYSQAFPGSTSPGSLLVIAVSANYGATTLPGTGAGFTTPQTNSTAKSLTLGAWVVNNNPSGNKQGAGMWYLPGASNPGGDSSILFNQPITGGCVTAWCYEFAGVAPVSPDVLSVGAAATTSVTAWNSSAITPSAGQLLVGMVCGPNGGTNGYNMTTNPGAPFTNLDPAFFWINGGINENGISGYAIGASGSQAYDAVMPSAQFYAGFLAQFAMAVPPVQAETGQPPFSRQPPRHLIRRTEDANLVQRRYFGVPRQVRPRTPPVPYMAARIRQGAHSPPAPGVVITPAKPLPSSQRDTRREPKVPPRAVVAEGFLKGVSQPPIPPEAVRDTRREPKVPPRSSVASWAQGIPQPPIPPEAVRDTRRPVRIPPRAYAAGSALKGASQPPIPPEAVRDVRREPKVPPRGAVASWAQGIPQPPVPPGTGIRHQAREPRIPPRSVIALGWLLGRSQPPIPPGDTHQARGTRRPVRIPARGSAEAHPTGGLTIGPPKLPPGTAGARRRPGRLQPPRPAPSPASPGYVPPGASPAPRAPRGILRPGWPFMQRKARTPSGARQGVSVFPFPPGTGVRAARRPVKVPPRSAITMWEKGVSQPPPIPVAKRPARRWFSWFIPRRGANPFRGGLPTALRDSDFAFAVDSGFTFISDSDTCQASDAVAQLGPVDSDTCQAAERELSNWPADSDACKAADAGYWSGPVADSDVSGPAADGGEQVTILDTEACAATDASAVPAPIDVYTDIPPSARGAGGGFELVWDHPVLGRRVVLAARQLDKALLEHARVLEEAGSVEFQSDSDECHAVEDERPDVLTISVEVGPLLQVTTEVLADS
jgi:hypothetical protein